MKINFSIVVPFYNEEENIALFFDELIKIIFNINKLHNFEIICINDGSKDKTNIFLNEYKKKYDFIENSLMDMDLELDKLKFENKK